MQIEYQVILRFLYSLFPQDITQKRSYLSVMDDAEAQRVRRGYYAAVSFTDSLVGKLLSELKALGFENNTIVSFHADHGWQLGEVRSS